MLVNNNSIEEINKALLALQKQIAAINDSLNRLKEELKKKENR